MGPDDCESDMTLAKHPLPGSDDRTRSAGSDRVVDDIRSLQDRAGADLAGFVLSRTVRDRLSGNEAAAGIADSMSRDVTAHYYSEARHEILSETKRDEITADVRPWLTSVRP